MHLGGFPGVIRPFSVRLLGIDDKGRDVTLHAERVVTVTRLEVLLELRTAVIDRLCPRCEGTVLVQPNVQAVLKL